MRKLLALPLAAALLLTACGGEPAAFTEESGVTEITITEASAIETTTADVTETTASAITTAPPLPEPEPLNVPPDGFTGEELRLWNSVAEAVDKSVTVYDIADYDGDGTLEMFAVVAEKKWRINYKNEWDGYYSDSVCFGELWYANGGGAELVREDGVELWFEQFGSDKYVFFCPYTGFVVNCWVFGVKDGQWFESEMSMKSVRIGCDSDGEVVCTYSATDSGSLDGGRNFRPYWLYYDEGEHQFYEYGAVEITLEQLAGFENSALVIDIINEYAKLPPAYPDEEFQEHKVVSVLYKGNGYIHVNLLYEKSEWEDSRHYITAKYKDNAIYEILKDEESNFYLVTGKGFYEPALYPEIAVYPDITGIFD